MARAGGAHNLAEHGPREHEPAAVGVVQVGDELRLQPVRDVLAHLRADGPGLGRDGSRQREVAEAHVARRERLDVARAVVPLVVELRVHRLERVAELATPAPMSLSASEPLPLERMRESAESSDDAGRMWLSATL